MAGIKLENLNLLLRERTIDLEELFGLFRVFFGFFLARLNAMCGFYGAEKPFSGC